MDELRAELNAIRARLDAATEGPWKEVAADEANAVTGPKGPITWDDHNGEVFEPGDSNFIAHARTDVERLLKMVEGALSMVKVMESTAKAVGKLPMTEDLARELPVAYETSAVWLQSVLEDRFNGIDT